MAEPDPDVVIEHPNREKASSKATKAAVLLLLVAPARSLPHEHAGADCGQPVG